MIVMFGTALSLTNQGSAEETSPPSELTPRSSARVVLIEEFTATWCGHCPNMRAAAEQIANDYGKAQVALLEYHVWDSGNNLDTSKTNDRADDYDVAGIPDLWVDKVYNVHGNQGSVQANYNAIQAHVDNRLNVNSPLSIYSEGLFTSSSITLNATINAPGSVPQSNLKARFVIYENSISDGGNTYHYVVRDMFEQSISNSSFPQEIQRQFTVQGGWNFQNMEAVIFVQVGDSGEILQASNAGINFNFGPHVKTSAPSTLSFDEDSMDSTLDLDNIFEDAENDPMTFSHSGNNKIGVSIGSNGVVTFTPEEDWNGGEVITFKADDGNGVGNHPMIIDVLPVNDPPVVNDQFSGDKSITILEDTPSYGALDLNDIFYDIDGDNLDYIVSAAEHMEVSITDGSVDITPETDWTGEEVLTFTASDAEAVTVDKDITVKVASQNDGPRIQQPLVNITMDEDTVNTDMDLSKVFTDPEGESLFIYADGMTYLTVEIDSDFRVTITPDEDWNGEEVLTFTATDGAAQVKDDVSVTVVPVNDPPTLLRIEGKVFDEGLELEVKEDEESSLGITAEDIDGDDLEHHIDGVDLPESLEIDGTNGEIYILPTNDDVGSYDIMVTVEDGDGETDTKSFTLTVMNENDPPVAVISSPADQANFMVDEMVTLDASGSFDIDVDNVISYLWSSDLEGDLGENKVSTYTFKEPGYHEIILTVADVGGLSSAVTIHLTINADETTETDDGEQNNIEDTGGNVTENTEVDTSSSSDSALGMGKIGGIDVAYVVMSVIIIIIILFIIVLFIRKRKTQPPSQAPSPKPASQPSSQHSTPVQPQPQYQQLKEPNAYQGGSQSSEGSTITPTPLPDPGAPAEAATQRSYLNNEEYSAWNSVSDGFSNPDADPSSNQLDGASAGTAEGALAPTDGPDPQLPAGKIEQY